jgi:hypothetical protein
MIADRLDTAELRVALAGAGRVLVVGDTHGNIQTHRRVTDAAVELGIRVVLHVGDLGVGPWPHEPRDKMLYRLDRDLEAAGAWLLLTGGNHENWTRIDAAAIDETDDLGFAVLGLAGRVRVFGRPGRVTVGGRVVASVGGAVSVDQRWRTAGESWWPQEAVTPAMVDALGDEPADVLVTHEVPAGVPVASDSRLAPVLAVACDEQRSLVRRALEQVRPAAAFSGHWHQRVTADVARTDGGTTRVEVLDCDGMPENVVVLDLASLEVAPLRAALQAHRRPVGDAQSAGEPAAR